MSGTTNTTTTEVSEPEAIAVEAGVDLLLPPSTPRDVLDVFVASCNIGQCDCDTTFVSKITGVELYDEPGRLRVHITGDVTPEEVLAEMVASAPHLKAPPA
ncbi:MAG: hypothetical protein NVSMB4_18130 [Acidimicrobiales bacterium]